MPCITKETKHYTKTTNTGRNTNILHTTKPPRRDEKNYSIQKRVNQRKRKVHPKGADRQNQKYFSFLSDFICT